MALRIRKGDLVKVIAGADRGKQGRVMAVDRERNRVRVEKVRMQKRHLKPGRRQMSSGGIIEQEGYINVSNVMVIDPGTNEVSRIGVEERGGRRTRVFRKSGDAIPDPNV